MPKALRLEGPGKLTFVDEEDALLRPRAFRFAAVRSGISHGTELSFVRGASPFEHQTFDMDLRVFRPNRDGDEPLYPMPLGYEMVGRVTETGPAVDGFAVGDLIHVGASHGDGGTIDLDDPFAEEFQPTKIAEDEIDRSLFLSLAGVALQAVHDAEIRIGDAIAIYGLGTVGLLAVQLARAAGAGCVIAVDPVAERRELALGMGAHAAVDPTVEGTSAGAQVKQIAGHGLDVAVEIAGSYHALQQAIASVAPRGRVVSAGFYSGDGGALTLGQEWHHNAVVMVGSQGGWGCNHPEHPRWTPQRMKETALRLMRDGTLDVSGIAVELVPFADAPSAYARLEQAHGELVKLAFTYA
jgi:threonine dehydrogenase-like Zn-dependent dehydrogenase